MKPRAITARPIPPEKGQQNAGTIHRRSGFVVSQFF
jgi:hypothetical protein